MSITVLLDPSQMPNQSQDQATFDNNTTNFVASLPIFGQQVNALAANLNSVAAGGAYALNYTYANKGVIGDGAGMRMSFDGASGFTPSSATLIYLENTDLRGSVVATVASFSASSSAVKGQILVVNQGDTSQWVRFNVNAITAYSNFNAVDVTPIDSSASNPFSYGDTLLVQFQRTGDKGDSGSLTPVLWVRDEKASGTGGGSAAALNYTTRTLNTIKKNTISGASVASNQITLPAGTYRISFSAPAYNVSGHQAYLYNVTDAVTAISGSTAYVPTTALTESSVRGTEIVLTASKVFELRHWTNTGTAGTGLGFMASSGQGEVYAQVFIEKVA